MEDGESCAIQQKQIKCTGWLLIFYCPIYNALFPYLDDTIINNLNNIITLTLRICILESIALKNMTNRSSAFDENCLTSLLFFTGKFNPDSVENWGVLGNTTSFWAHTNPWGFSRETYLHSFEWKRAERNSVPSWALSSPKWNSLLY